MEDFHAYQVKAGSTKNLPLEKFQKIPVPFHDSIAIRIDVAVQLPAGYLVPVVAAPVSEDQQSPLFISS